MINAQLFEKTMEAMMMPPIKKQIIHLGCKLGTEYLFNHACAADN